MPVVPGGSLLVSCRVRSADVASGMPVIGMARYRADGSWDDWSYCLRVPANRDWSEYREVFVVPETTAEIGCYMIPLACLEKVG